MRLDGTVLAKSGRECVLIPLLSMQICKHRADCESLELGGRETSSSIQHPGCGIPALWTEKFISAWERSQRVSQSHGCNVSGG